jgi:hypothetical protein
MAIFEFTSDKISKIAKTTFEQAGLKERGDLQRLLRSQFDIIDPDVLIISEEFGEWEDSRRRIDLLGLDKNANLVVVELKRTEDGGHMELQTVRYAAMISTMTFEQAVEIFQGYLRKRGDGSDARMGLLNFFSWEEPDEDMFAQDVRIILLAADFSREITTSALWLIERGIDIRCIRLRPFADGARLLVDIQQIIPLPEAEDFMISLREKSALERFDRGGSGAKKHQLRTEFWQGLLDLARSRTKLFEGVSARPDNWIGTSAGVANAQFQFVVRKYDGEIQFALIGEKEWNKASFDQLIAHRNEIEKVFGIELEWMRQDDFKQSYIRNKIGSGGIFSEKARWPEIQLVMIEKMILLEKAVSQFVRALRKQQ